MPVPSEDPATLDLFRRCRDGDRTARERLLFQYAPLVKYVASRVAAGLPRSIDQLDLISYGMLGLLDAIDRYDPVRSARFTTYAAPRIRGAILDELRSLDWVPRSIRTKRRAVETAIAELEFRLGGTPTERQLADELAVGVDDLRVTFTEMSRTTLATLDVDYDGGVPLAEQLQDPAALDPQKYYDEPELHADLADAIAGLPERQRTALVLYFYEGLTLSQVGRAMGVTESRASQLRASAMLHLREQLVARGVAG